MQSPVNFENTGIVSDTVCSHARLYWAAAAQYTEMLL